MGRFPSGKCAAAAVTAARLLTAGLPVAGCYRMLMVVGMKEVVDRGKVWMLLIREMKFGLCMEKFFYETGRVICL